MGSDAEQKRPIRANMDMIQKLQEQVAPEIFTPRCAYDGRKNMYTTRKLPLPDGKQSFEVPLRDPASPGGTPQQNQKYLKITITEAAQYNPVVLQRFLEGRQSHDNEVLTVITALNVVVRMEPTSRFPFNVRSFFTPDGKRDIGNGFELWRGYFQSVRPAVGRMLLNVDISTAMMYKEGPLIDLALDHLGKRGGQPNLLAPSRGLPPHLWRDIQHFLRGVKIVTNVGAGRGRGPRMITSLSRDGARQLSFTRQDGTSITVADYYRTTYNTTLRFPDVICAGVGTRGEYIPFELCFVPSGQIMRKEIPPDKQKAMVEFSTLKPFERLDSIRAALGVLAHGQSEYVRQFGLHVDGPQPLRTQARVLPPPTLQYGPGSKPPTVTPREGTWNMADRKLYRPAAIAKFVIAVYDGRFNQTSTQELARSLVVACKAVGIRIEPSAERPYLTWPKAQGNIANDLREAGRHCYANMEPKNTPPTLIVVVLPENAANLYREIKHFGDILQGVPTQCLKATKCGRGNAQYFANVCLKINVKLGGINTIPDRRSAQILTDPHNPTMIMGADVGHPAAYSRDRPSFSSVVASVDSNTSLYVADCRVQEPRLEIIADLEAMTKNMIAKFKSYHKGMEKTTNTDPKRIIFFRDGVSEGQFRQVLDIELPRIKAACESLGIRPAITFIVVGKRHHVRFFPVDPNDPKQADRSKNCKAGTIVDRDVTHPVEFDFYLQSHAGLLGTSRPAHYSVLYDDSNFSVNALQELCFTLCHVYARCTRSVSIPAPVYYADIVCDRAKNHFDPTQGDLNLESSDTATDVDVGARVERFTQAFKPLHANMSTKMYFS
ncbi:hypothetical protein PHLGIDRAFT_36273 [Phlebiopsis gigantea 11061_1 CR5-6]|uniref:Piwi domain-containing protein n=1 Tax=Phlebiopsis gigantea (strain 11061_1 CR5-6) TaxID=745531 RepID=A0A0C3RW86_PHLG1|nr:hypothetical protein PHLGIDRAFT_36273 [Phlebiopsis gigantea 11061_1 CR5-6]